MDTIAIVPTANKPKIEPVIIAERKDRVIEKVVEVEGDFRVFPTEGSRCQVKITNLKCHNELGECSVDVQSLYMANDFDGYITLGDADHCIDIDIDYSISRMNLGEASVIGMKYTNEAGNIERTYNFRLELISIEPKPLPCEWDWEMLIEHASIHKERGVKLISEKRFVDGFRRFSRGYKFIVQLIQKIRESEVPDDQHAAVTDLQVKLLNNMAFCQLQYQEYEAALSLTEKILVIDPENIKALYRRGCARMGLELYEEALQDMLRVISVDETDLKAQQKIAFLKGKVKIINQEYNQVIRKMFS